MSILSEKTRGGRGGIRENRQRGNKKIAPLRLKEKD